MEKYKCFHTQKRNKVKNVFEKDFFKLIINASYAKTIENVRNPLRLEFIKKYGYKKMIKRQSKLTFNGLYKSYENCDSYIFKKNGILMGKPLCLGFAVLE